MCTLILLPVLLAGLLVLIRLLSSQTDVVVRDSSAPLPAVSGVHTTSMPPVLEYATPATRWVRMPTWAAPAIALASLVPAGTCLLMLVAVLAGRRELGHWASEIPHYAVNLRPFEHWAFHKAFYGLLIIALVQVAVVTAAILLYIRAEPDERRIQWAIVAFWTASALCLLVDAITGYTQWALY